MMGDLEWFLSAIVHLGHEDSGVWGVSPTTCMHLYSFTAACAVCVSSQDTLFLAFVSVCFFPLLSSAEAVLALLLYGVRSCYFLKHMVEVVRT